MVLKVEKQADKFCLFVIFWLLTGLFSPILAAGAREQSLVRPVSKAVASATPTPTLPVLLVYNNSNTANPFGPFLGEIMKAEGFNLYDSQQLANVTASLLANYDSVVLAQTPLTAAQAAFFSNYVAGGGNLIAMRPDPNLAATLGLGNSSSTLANAYMAIQNNTFYGQGFTTQSLQLHTTADLYPSPTAQVISTLYSNSATPTSYPAVTVNSYGSGTAAAFTYDLATSVVYTRQGNPNQLDVDADGDGIVRIVDMYYNWVDLNKMPLPQADIQQRLFARILGKLNSAKKPLPRFWYFPNAKNTAVVLTSDAHGNPDTYYANMVSSMGQYNATTTFFMSQAGQPSATNVNSWKSKGFTFSTHPYKVDTPLSTGYDNVDSWFDTTYGTRTSKTVRVHRLQWQGWVDAAKIGLARGYAMDYTPYRFGNWLKKPDGSWAQGYMTGSGLPMKFIDQNGSIVNYFGQYTEIADDQMLAAGSGPEGLNDATAYQYTKQAIDASEAGDNQAVAIQMHVDYYSGEQTWAENTLSYTRSLNLPLFNGDAWYNFTQNRYDSTFTNINWSGSQLSFTSTLSATQSGQTLMLPLYAGNGGAFSSLTVNGASLTTTTQAVRGESFVFAVLPAGVSNVIVNYPGGTNPPPSISNASPNKVSNNASTTITVNGGNFLASPTVQLGTQFLNGVSLISSTSLTAVVPSGLALGTYDLKLTNPDNQSATLVGGVTVALPPPTVTSASPPFASNGSNVTLTIAGTNFVSGANVSLGSTALATSFISATGLTAIVPAGTTPGTYNITVTNPDNQSATLTNYYTVGSASDTTPPSLSSISAAGVTSSGAIVNWSTSEPANSQVDYGLTNNYGSQTALNNNLVTGHSQIISGLNGNATYHYRVRSTDASGNTAVSGDFTFVTPPTQPVTLVGDQTIESQQDNNPTGIAEAFQFTAIATGPVNQLYIYLDSTNTATRVIIGLYNDNAGNPGSLLTQGTITGPVAGSWNSVNINAGPTVTSGQKYWLAVLGPSSGGIVQFRDTPVGGKAQASAQSTLTSLPATWSPGANYGNSPMSAYAVQTGAAGADTTPPTVSITAPANGTTVTGTAVTVSGNASDNVGVTGVQFLLDNNPLGSPVTAAPYTISWNTTSASDGVHTLTARASDAAGNTSTATAVSVTIDNTPPVISAVLATNIQTTSATINWTTNEGSTTQVEYGLTTAYGNLTPVNTSLVTSHSQGLSSLTAGSPYNYRVLSKDAAGNTATSGNFTFVTLSPADSTPPTVNITAPTDGSTVSGSAVNISANASDNVGVTSVQFFLDGILLGSPDTTAPYSITWDTTNAANGTHTLKAQAKDAVGNSTTSATVSVTVNNTPPDTTPPTVNISVPANGATVSGTAVTVSANASDNVGVASVQFLLDGANLGSPDTTAPYSITWDTTTATNGSHTLTAQAKDAAGNISTSAAVSFTVNNVDTTPPLISAVAATAITSSGATINWTTNELADSQVEYGTTTAYGSQTTLNASLVTGHSQALNGLNPSTLYHYRVKSKDGASNLAVSGDFTFTSASAAPITLAGDQIIENQQDSNLAGLAEAFQYTATASGTSSKFYIYLNSSNTASQLVVGLYTNNATTNNPATLLGQATITGPVSGAWNSVSLPGVSLVSGQKYWLAVLGPLGGGTVKFVDKSGGGKAQVSSQNNLTSLPATWSPGKTYNDSPMSAYITS